MVKIFDRWANESGQRLQVWRAENGDIRFIAVDGPTQEELGSITLAKYRAEDLARILSTIIKE